jgi:hypothetical protein
MAGFDSALDIINKLLPTQDRRDIVTLDDLIAAYAIALQKGMDTEASVLRKEIRRLEGEIEHEKTA